MLTSKGWEGALERVVVSVDPRVQRALIGPFTGQDRRGLFTDLDTPWDALDLAYFTGCALWTSLTVPFLLNENDFVTEELEPWHEDHETWRRLRAVFPERIACQNRDQIFYFGPDGLLRRHDYNMDIVAGVPTADYTDDHQIFGGISFPTLRRAVRRLPDGLTEPEPAFFAVDIADVTVAWRE